MYYEVHRVQIPNWEAIPAVTLCHTPWLTPNDVKAQAQLCHDGQTLFLRMQARESSIRATVTGQLELVCNDSCLEFFFAPDAEDSRYLNFEVNPLGTLYVGFGAERATRARQILKSTDMFQIQTFRTEDGWGLTMQIPLRFVQMYFPNAEFAGVAACNFYKCGEETVSPHYLAWNPLTCEKPDYHRRQDFGTLQFLS